MLEHKELLNSILQIAHMDLLNLARDYAEAAFMDLASAPSNQVMLVNNEKLLGMLLKMVNEESFKKQQQEGQGSSLGCWCNGAH
jgi:hypothetical protein